MLTPLINNNRRNNKTLTYFNSQVPPSRIAMNWEEHMMNNDHHQDQQYPNFPPPPIDYHPPQRGLQSLIPNDEDDPIPSYDESMRSSSFVGLTNINTSIINTHTRHNSQGFTMSTSSSVSMAFEQSVAQDDILPPQPSTTDSQGSSTEASRTRNKQMNHLKLLGLTLLNAKQHLALAACRDCVLIPPLYHAFRCFKRFFEELHMTRFLQPAADGLVSRDILARELIQPRSSEFFIVGIWCLVSAYLSYQVLDGLMVRWIVTYQTTAAILRMLSVSLLIICTEQALLSIFSPWDNYSLHTWILISCVLTGAYILQNFVTSNLDLKNGKKQRTIDYYNITVFAVVPVGLASFVSMIGLLRALLILRLDLDGCFENGLGGVKF